MITFLLSSLALAADPATTTPPATTPPAKTTPTAPAGTTPATPATPAAPALAVPVFVDLDLNKDLSLDKTEIAKLQNLTRDFATIDTDKNGKLSQDEYKAWGDKQPKPGATPATPAAPAPTKG